MSVLSSTACGNCQAPNQSAAQFCEGCGQPLFEMCPGCSTSVRIGQVFCNHCGCDLKSKLRERLEKFDQQLAQAEEFAGHGEYNEAYLTVHRISKAPDYRFAKVAELAAEAAKKYASLRDSTETRINDLMPQAKKAFEERRYADVLKMVDGLPEQAMSEELVSLLSLSRDIEQERLSLIQGLAVWLKERKLIDAASATDRLMQIDPDVSKWEAWGKKIGSEQIKDSLAHRKLGRFGPAMKLLEAVPTHARNEEYQTNYAALKEIFWLRSNLLLEPFVSPNLVKASERLVEVAANDKVAAEILETLKKQLKTTRPQSPMGLFVPWKSTTVKWLNYVPLELWGRLQNVEVKAVESITKAPTRFHVAIGLALQSLGSARINLQLGKSAPAKKGIGVAKLFARKKVEGPKVGWGLDIGASGIRVVCLELAPGETKPVVKHAAIVAFSSPLFRPDMQEKGPEELQAGLKKIVAHFSLVGQSVAVNLSSRQLLGRFVMLPPIKEKELEKLIKVEVKSQFPFLTEEEAASTHWMGDPGEGEMSGRPLAVIAARSQYVNERLKLLTDAGVEDVTVVPSPVALVNFMYHEVGPSIAVEKKVKVEEKGKKKKEKEAALAEEKAAELAAKEELESQPIAEKKPRPTIVALDAGCECSTVAVIADDRFWFRTMDSGGDSFCVALSKGLTKTYAETDKLKLRPVETPNIALAYQGLEPVLAQHWERVKQLVGESESFMEKPETKYFLLSGGACLLLGYAQPAVK